VASKKDEKDDGGDDDADRKKGRRKRRLKIGGAVLALLVIAVVVAVVVSSSSSTKPRTNAGGALQGVVATETLFTGVPQHGLVLGSPKARVTLYEYADLECPDCSQYALDVLPQIVRRYVRGGRVKLVFRNLPLLDTQSRSAAHAAAAASAQNKMWNYTDLWYRNQGAARSGYATDAFMRKVGRGVNGLDVERMMHERGLPAADAIVKQSATDAAALKISSTPSFVLQVAGGRPQVLQVQAPYMVPAFTQPIEALLART
jgi:protein-disulfide isomerase